LQQTPSEQFPLTHPVPSAHGCPFWSLHWPAASQLLGFAHVSTSGALTTAEQVPFEFAHERQVPVHAVPQQRPSLQIPLEHSATALHP
jgi:hypothetical protein